MNKSVVFILRIPVVILAVAGVFSVVAKPSLKDIVMCLALLAFCFAIWSGIEALNGPSTGIKSRLAESSKNMTRSGLTAAIGMLVYKLLQQWWPNA